MPPTESSSAGFRFADLGLPLDVINHAALAGGLTSIKANTTSQPSLLDLMLPSPRPSSISGLELRGFRWSCGSQYGKAKMKERWLRDGVAFPACEEIDNKNEARRVAARHVTR